MQYKNDPRRRTSPGGQVSRRPDHPGTQRQSGTARRPIDPAQRQAEIARRRAKQAEMERRRIMEENRRRAKRQRAVRVFFGRTLVFFIILLLLAAVTAVGFFIHFNHTTPAEEPARVSYFFGGEEGNPLTEDMAYRDGVLYIDFHDAAVYLHLTAVGGGDSMRYVITDEVTDSAGNGMEEEVIFYTESDLAKINGQQIRMEGKAVLSGDHYLIPLSFIEEHMQGVLVHTEKNAVSVSRIFTDPEALIASPVSFRLKPAKPAEPVPEDTVGIVIDPPVTEPPAAETVTFKSDLSAYEKYMNPEDRDGYLTLVNENSTIDESYLPKDLTDVADTRKDGRNTQKMAKTAAMALEAMFIELRANGYTDVSVTSAYRSYTYQAYLFNMYTEQEMAANKSLTRAEAEAITETYSARPGTSEHQTGLCCDMHNLSSAQTAFAQQEAYKWLKDNCWKFGFIIRFPEGKQEITGISFEPWHYRFVGRYHAKAIYESGLCLEEYLETIG